MMINILKQMMLNKIKLHNPHLNESKLLIVKFGLECLLSEFSKFLAYFFIFWSLSLLNYYLIAVIVYCTIRAASGGYHAKSYIGCFIISFLVFYTAAILGKNLHILYEVRTILLILSALLFALFSPVDHPNKPIRDLGRRRKLKHLAVLLSSAWGIFSFVLPNEVSTTITISICLAATMLPLGITTNNSSKNKSKVELLSNLKNT